MAAYAKPLRSWRG